MHDDERPVERATLSMLDSYKLERYILRRRTDRPGFTQFSREQTLEMLNITRDGEVTLAAVMNFCLYPQGYILQLGITAIVIPGKQIGDTDTDSARFTDNKRIEGTIDTMVEDAVAFCRRNMKIRTIINPITGARNDRTEYPIEAIREAVLNAVIHRDYRDYSIYTEGTPVQIDFFTDRLEIHSPGSLYGRMTVEQLGIARPDLRNPALAVMAEELTSAENRYSGIPTIRRAMSEYGLPDPVFENRRNEFVVILYNQSAAVTDVIMENSERTAEPDLLTFCKTPRSRQEIASYLGIKTVFYAMSNYVQPLLQSGQLAMTILESPKSRKQKFYTV